MLKRSLQAARIGLWGMLVIPGIIGLAANETAVSRPEAAGQSPEGRLLGKVVCIDPGHQTKIDMTVEAIAPDSNVKKVQNPGGATGVRTGTPECVVNLKIGMELKALLEKEGALVVMTRAVNNVNLGNIARAEIANQAKADLFVRIHCDGSADPKVSGTSVLYPANIECTRPIYRTSRKAAVLVQEELVKACRRRDNGTVMRADLTGFNWAKVPSILVEVAFLSNPEEDRLLNTEAFQKKAAAGIYQGIIRYFGDPNPSANSSTL